MSDLRTAAQQALEALKNTVEYLPVHFDEHFEAIEALRAALAQPQRQPLTDDQIDAIVRSNVTITDQNLSGAVYMAMREVEAAHGIEEQP